MKAVILAGGKGTRLYPLTQSRPKPMVPLLGAPILAHTLALLAHHGVKEAAVTVGYLSGSVSGFFKNEFCGIRLEYFGESLPLGTAGAVKACGGFLGGNEPFAVISGDAVTDADLGAAFRFHREKNAAATLILKKCPDPLEFGVVRTDASGRITGFVEKPEWSEVCSDKVNTGIYILSPCALELVPEKTRFDFSRDLFPRLLSAGEALFGFVTDSYWCDVGSPASYRRCTADALSGKVRLYLYDPDRSGSAAFSHRGFVDPSASVAADALVKNSVILSGTVVGSGACVTDSVVTENCSIAGGSVVKDSVLDRGSRVGAGAVVCSGSTVGEGSRIADGSLCAAGRLAPGTVYSFNQGEKNGMFFENGVFVFDHADRSALGRFGSAAAKTFALPLCASGADSGSVGALCAGASSVRTFVSDADSPAVASFSAAVMGCVGAHVESLGCAVRIHLFMPDGYRVGVSDRRRLTAAFRSEFSPPEASARAESLFIKQIYLSRLAASIPAECPPFACDSGPGASDLLAAVRINALLRRGSDAVMVFGFGGDALTVRFADGATFDMLSVIRLFLDLRHQRRVWLEPPIPSLLISRAPGLSELDDDSRRKSSPTTLDRLYFHDPAFAAAELLRIASSSGADQLEKMLARIPPVCIEKRFVALRGTPESFAEKIDSLASKGLLGGDAVRIVPGGPGAFRIWAQSTRVEAARELCDMAQDLISE